MGDSPRERLNSEKGVRSPRGLHIPFDAFTYVR